MANERQSKQWHNTSTSGSPPKAPPVRSRLSQCGGTDQWRIPSTSGSSPSRLICREFLRPCTEARAVAASLIAKKHPPAHTHTHTCCNSLANTRTSCQWHSEACATPKPNTCVSSVCKRGLCLSGPRHHQFSYCQTQKLKNYCAHEINFQTSCARAHQTIYHVRSYAIRRSPRRWQFTGQGHTHARAHTHRVRLYTRGVGGGPELVSRCADPETQIP